jgi:hypothetical protein
MNKEDAYNHYLMSHLLDAYTDQLRFIECDESWEVIKYHMKKFKESEYYVVDQSMYEAIEAYVKEI